MSDEELTDTLDNTTDGDETTSQDVSEDTPSDNTYCTREEINSLFGDISDEITDDLFNTVINNSTAWIDSNLQKAFIPVPVITLEDLPTISDGGVSQSQTHVNYNLINVPNGLKTAAIYYAASDILLALYHGDELPIQYDVWFNKAQSLLNDYIEGYFNGDDADAGAEDAHRRVKHSHGLTYNQKRGRGQRWRTRI